MVVWGHELAAVSLFVMVLGLFVTSVFKSEKIPYRLLVSILPALTVFVIGAFRIFPSAVITDTNILEIGDSFFARSGGLFFLTDYLSVFTPVEHYTSYFELFSHVFSLFLLLYVALLPLIIVGYFKDRVISSWSLLLLIGSFSCLILPFSGLLLWNRWMLMLIFPFTFFAVEGLCKVAKYGEAFSISRFLAWFKITKKVAIGLSLLTFVVGCLFMTWPLIEGKYGIIGVENTFRYVPSTMQSSSVPLQDTQGTIEAYNWLNAHMNAGSSLLVHDVFEFWTMFYLEEQHIAFVFDNDVEAAVDFALENGYEETYLVWWNEDFGWYNLRLSQDWVSVFDSGRISVYQMV
jgi:hypothetical protein